MKGYSVQKIGYIETKSWLKNRHYAKRMPSVVYSFGLYKENDLVGVITYGIPASPFLCKGICGVEFSKDVLELTRLCLLDNLKNEASFLIGNTLKKIKKAHILVSYADTDFDHIGYIYQATNWLYTGATKQRTDMFSESGHSRHNMGESSKRQFRSSKYRYVYFIGSKKEKKQMLAALKYPILPYPKGESKRYEVPETQERQLNLF